MAGGSPAQAATVTCGQTITADTTVDNDLTCPSSNGLVIGANAITLDLNGHRLQGRAEPDSGGQVGILVSGRSGVTIENGRIERFGQEGIRLTGATDTVLRDLVLTGSLSFGTGLDTVLVDGASSGNRLVDVTSRGPSLGFHPALNLQGDDNEVVGGSYRGFCDGPGVTITGDGNLVRNAQLHHQSFEGSGCPAERFLGTSSLELLGGDGNKVIGNRANTNQQGGNGIFVAAAATNTLVQGNVANTNGPFPGIPENGGDGIRVEDPSAEIGGNLSDGNVELGIRAVAGVTDAGGNTAQGNQDSRQCLNVACDSSLLGSRNVGPSFSSMSTNVKRASPFVVYYPVRVSELNAYLDGGGAASGSQTVRGLIYRSASGQPTALVATSSVVTIDAGRPPGFVDLPVGGSPVLQPGVYWLGLHSGLTHGVARFAWNPVANHRRYYIDAFGDGAGSPFGPSLVDDQQITIFASGLYGAGGGSSRR